MPGLGQFNSGSKTPPRSSGTPEPRTGPRCPARDDCGVPVRRASRARDALPSVCGCATSPLPNSYERVYCQFTARTASPELILRLAAPVTEWQILVISTYPEQRCELRSPTGFRARRRGERVSSCDLGRGSTHDDATRWRYLDFEQTRPAHVRSLVYFHVTRHRN